MARTPARWPNEWGRLRFRAHRPFPSMMMPTWCGAVWASAGTTETCLDGSAPGCPFTARCSDLHHLRLLAAGNGVDAARVGIGHLLQLVARPPGLVLGELARPLLLVDALELVPAHVADGDPRLLGPLLDHLHVLAASFLGQDRDGHADHLAVVGRVEPHPRVADRLLHGAHLAAVVDLDDEEARLGGADLGQLVQGGRRPVVGHRDPLDERGVGTSGPDAGELVLQVLDRLAHLGLRLLEYAVDAHAPVATSVPIWSPQTTRSMFPSFSRSNTTIGTPLSMHSVSAVLSMTSMPRFSTSR